MPLILEPDAHNESSLAELVLSLLLDLREARELIVHPRGPVIDPASLDTARELVDAALAQIGRDGPRTRGDLAVEANLAYATMLAVIDLVKSHVDVPRVPTSRGDPGSSAP